MTVSNPIRFGSNSALAAPTYDDLYLPIFGGEVLTRFNEYLSASASVKRQTIMTGNTAVFPRLGGIGAERHAVGSKLLGLPGQQSEITITLDERPLVSHFRLDDIDRAMSHFEIRSEMAAQAAQALAESQDRYTLRLLINASRKTPTALYGGSASTFPGGGIDGAGTALSLSLQAAGARPTDDQIGTFLDGLDQIVERWDQLRVPFQGRKAFVDVPHWHGIRQFGSPRSASDLDAGRRPLFLANDGVYGSGAGQEQFRNAVRDFNAAIDYNDIMITRTNLMPNGSDLSDDDEAKYQGNFTATRAIVFQQEAVALAVKMGVMTEAERDVSRQDWLFVAKMLSGGGTLRAECAVEITDSD
jgi:hypothetical protein